MICGMTYYQICWYFLVYSFGGWVVEVIFHAVTLGKVINRGFLNGPVCPVYGFGVISVFAMINTLQSSGYQMSDGMIFIFGVILATVVELIAGWLLDVCFHARWWDYSDKPLNFHGYICLEFSLIWGLAIVLVVKVFQRYVENHTSSHADSLLGWVVLAILYAAYLADFIVTVAVIRGLNKKLTRLDKIRSDMRIVSDKISDTLATTTIETAQAVGERKFRQLWQGLNYVIRQNLRKINLWKCSARKKLNFKKNLMIFQTQLLIIQLLDREELLRRFRR